MKHHFNWNIWKFSYFLPFKFSTNSIVKRWHFPDNLEFKGYIVANVLLKSNFLSIYNNMTIKQQINHGAIQWHFLFHWPVSHFVNINLSPLLCYSLKTTNYEMRERKIFCILLYYIILYYIILYYIISYHIILYYIMLTYHVISMEVENHIFIWSRIFRHMYV